MRLSCGGKHAPQSFVTAVDTIHTYAYVLITKLGSDMCGGSKIQVEGGCPVTWETGKAAIYKMRLEERKRGRMRSLRLREEGNEEEL